MAGRLEQMETLLREALGGELLARCPDLPYAVHRLALRFGHASDSPAALWKAIDSTLFNAVYAATRGSMVAGDGDGAFRITEDALTDLADRLLAAAYRDRPATPALRDALFDLSRAGSYAAMRELLSRFPLDGTERRYLEQVLSENGQAV